jgi:hypothetical protein
MKGNGIFKKFKRNISSVLKPESYKTNGVKKDIIKRLMKKSESARKSGDSKSAMNYLSQALNLIEESQSLLGKKLDNLESINTNSADLGNRAHINAETRPYGNRGFQKTQETSSNSPEDYDRLHNIGDKESENEIIVSQIPEVTCDIKDKLSNYIEQANQKVNEDMAEFEYRRLKDKLISMIDEVLKEEKGK